MLLHIQVLFDVGIVNDSGLRGAKALDDYEKGQFLAAIPFRCTIDAGPHSWTAPVWHHSPTKHLQSLVEA